MQADLTHSEEPFYNAFFLIPSATCPACSFYMAPLVPFHLLQSFLNQSSSNLDGFQAGTIDTLYSVFSINLTGESHLYSDPEHKVVTGNT